MASAYRSTNAKKVTLVAETDDELRTIVDAYRDVCGVTLVIDAGRTCFNGQQTVTFCGIGPIHDGLVGDDLRQLRVFI